MLDILLPLHQALEEGPATSREANFIQVTQHKNVLLACDGSTMQYYCCTMLNHFAHR
jgi:hypothetical protein